MTEFEAVSPSTVNECTGLMARYGPDAALVAGGTDLNVLIRTGTKTPHWLIYVGGIPELKMVEVTDGVVTIGSAVTHADLATAEVVAGVACLREAAGSIGSPQIRNMGTAGGNLANASPAADLYPALLTLNATVGLVSSESHREVAVDEFVTGPGTTALGPDEMIVRVAFTPPKGAVFSTYTKVGLRNAVAVSVASVALVATAGDGVLEDIRIACGAVAPRPVRLVEVESRLRGERPAPGLIREVGRIAMAVCQPISDIRASSTYRRHVLGVIVKRSVVAASSALLGYRGGEDGDA
jgi:CO/xanthine dehydrogenase FAD-binding subunit